MKKFDYAFSGTGFLMLPTKEMLENHPDSSIYPQYARAFDIAKKYAKDNFRNLDSKFSLLSNAYLEPDRINYFNSIGMNPENFYVDSGGLQMANLGMKITEADKEEVYNIQAKGDFGFCFDEIPLFVDESMGISKKNTRSTVSDKVFVTSEVKESAKRTGRNINTQIETFKRNNSNCKSIVIIQGNQVDDMVDFFFYCLSEIKEENYAHIGGVAVADTCMGNGALESCDMLAAWRKIYEQGAPDFHSKQLHFLGVGAFPRFYPVLCSMISQMIPDSVMISADSSKHSMGYQMGLYNGAFVSTKYGTIRNKTTDLLFHKVFDHFPDIVSEYYERDEYVDFFANRIDSPQTQIQEAKNTELAHFSRFNVFLHGLSSVMDMFRGFDEVFSKKEYVGKGKLENTIISNLTQVKNYDDYKRWRTQVLPYIASSRIGRNEIRAPINNGLGDFFV